MKHTLAIALAFGLLGSPAFAASNLLPANTTVQPGTVVQIAPSRAGRTQICVSQMRPSFTVAFSGNVNLSTLTGTASNHPGYVGGATLTSAGVNGHVLGAGATMCLGAYEGPLYGAVKGGFGSTSRQFDVMEVF